MTRTSEQSSRLNAGIVGAGFMGATHARAIRSAGRRVVAVVGSTPRRGAAAAEATGAEEALADVHQLLARDDIHVVHICTPNDLHESLAVQALRAGKHVVCEKPLASSAGSAGRIVDTAIDVGRLGTVPFVYRFHPMVRELRARVARGELGVPSVVHGGYLQDWLAGADATNWRVDAGRGGPSRAFADIGSHWFDLFEFVTGDRVDRLSAQTRTVFPRRGSDAPVTTEDAASVHFSTVGGILGTMVVSQVAAGRKNRLHLEISGDLASFAFDQEDAERLWAGRPDGGTTLVRDPERLASDAARLSFLPAGHPQGYQDAFNAYMADSYALFEGTAPIATSESVPQLAAGLRAAELCDAVIRSAHERGSWVDTDHLAS
jgi:predicted dehydrogenase